MNEKTYEMAIEKAKQYDNQEAYNISFDSADFVKSLIGKTLSRNGHDLEIIEWKSKALIFKMDGKDYDCLPAAWIVQNIKHFEVK